MTIDDVKEVLTEINKEAHSVRAVEQGKAGDCDTCGRYSNRLIEGMCKPCREKYDVK